MTDYRPGQCNIGRTERRKRLGLGVAGLAATGALVATLVVLDLPPLAYLLSIVPLYAGLLGVLQAKERFCIGFAKRGVYDVSEMGEARHEVSEEEYRRADRIHAVALALEALVGAFVGAACFYLLALVL